MARSFGRVFASIWDDDDFRALPLNARMMYVFLVSQPDLDHAGVIPLRIRRWSRSLDVPVADVEKMLGELGAARFTVTDWDTEELLVRSLVRRDEIWRQPNVFKSAAASAAAAKSGEIKRAILAEMRRLDLSSTSREIQRTRDDLVTLLEPFGNPSPTPPGASQNPPVSDAPVPLVDSEPDETGESRIDAGDKGSRRVPEPLANGSSEPTGKGIGEGYGPVPLVGLPPNPSPSPRAGREGSGMAALWPFPVPDARPEEGDQSGEQNPDIDIAALVAEVRKIRPAWSTKSIDRALRDQSVAERPWALVRAAMLAVARDSTSNQPGRLAHDGPWWRQALPSARESLPPVERHSYEPDGAGECSACGLPESNRRHLEAS